MNLIPISERDKTQWGDTFVTRLHKVQSIVLEVSVFGREGGIGTGIGWNRFLGTSNVSLLELDADYLGVFTL